MLILTRKVGEVITVGEDIQIHVMQVRGRQVRIGVIAPKNIKIMREEVTRRDVVDAKLSTVA